MSCVGCEHKADLTDHYIEEVLAWSLAALANGTYPSVDHHGVPFTAAHHPHRFALVVGPVEA